MIRFRFMVFTASIFFTFLVDLTNPSSDSLDFIFSDDFQIRSVFLASNQDFPPKTGLDYDFYRNSCPSAETIVRSKMAEIFSRQNDVAPALLRLFFHDCFVHGCDASVLLDDSDSNRNYSAEKQAVPNKTLRGFDQIDIIKEELEGVCPGVVSCADIISLATRDSVVLAGGPYYPVFTGRRDSVRSYHDYALTDIPAPDDHLPQILNRFAVKGFNERELVSLLGAHNIGQMGCDFIHNRLFNFNGTGQPDPTLTADFLNEMRLKCRVSTVPPGGRTGPFGLRNTRESNSRESISVPSGADFDTHYYQRLLTGRGLLFADQQLIAGQITERLVRAYASDDGSTFRMDFARALMKMSNLDVLTGSQGRVRLNCSLPMFSSR